MEKTTILQMICLNWTVCILFHTKSPKNFKKFWPYWAYCIENAIKICMMSYFSPKLNVE